MAGFVAATIGINWVFERVFDNSVSLPACSYGLISGGIDLQDSHVTATDFSFARIQAFKERYGLLSKMDESDRSRLRLALHWFDLGSRTLGVDALLQLWIALEALTATDKSHGKERVRSALQSAYGLGPKDFRFMIGEVHGFRGRIVHGGERLAVEPALIGYLKAAFEDVLSYRLGVPHEGKIMALLTKPGFDLRELLHLKPHAPAASHGTEPPAP